MTRGIFHLILLLTVYLKECRTLIAEAAENGEVRKTQDEGLYYLVIGK